MTSASASDDFIVVRKGKRLKRISKGHATSSIGGTDEVSDADVLRKLSGVESDLRSSGYLRDLLNILGKCVASGRTSIKNIVCYGLGNFSQCVSGRYQLGLLLCIREFFSADSIEIYDPVFTETERRILSSLNLSVLDRNEEGKRHTHEPTLFYMPHCGTPLYNSVLWANWDKASLNRIVILGNSFDTIWTNKLESTLLKKCSFLVNVRPAVREFVIANNFRFGDVFNDLALHTFDASLLPEDAWTLCEEPIYNEDDEIILALQSCRF